MYGPAVSAYQASCVNDHDHNGTSFLSANLNAAGYNFATEIGHNAIFNGLREYNSRSVSECSTFSSDAHRSYDLFIDEINLLVNKHDDVAYDYNLMEACVVNLTYHSSSFLIGDDFEVQCQESLSKNLIIEQIIHPHSVFNCSEALPLCAITCSGSYLELHCL